MWCTKDSSSCGTERFNTPGGNGGVTFWVFVRQVLARRTRSSALSYSTTSCECMFFDFLDPHFSMLKHVKSPYSHQYCIINIFIGSVLEVWLNTLTFLCVKCVPNPYKRNSEKRLYTLSALVSLQMFLHIHTNIEGSSISPHFTLSPSSQGSSSLGVPKWSLQRSLPLTEAHHRS